jgi:Gas vesicle protein
MRSDGPFDRLTPLERSRSTGLVDVLDRVLDKGLVIAGDVKISLAEVELLTIRIRLIVCSLDKAQEIGLDWWKYDHHLAPGKQRISAENDALRRQVRQLERQVDALTGSSAAPPRAKALRRRRFRGAVRTGV